jgi:hypothetical protein
MFRRLSRAFVRPAAAVAALVLLGEPSPELAAQSSLPSGRDVVARHIAAFGGEAAFKAVTSMHARGKISLTAQQIGGEVEVFSARPNRQLVRGTIAGIGQTETGFDGSVAWSIDPVQGATLLTGRQRTEMADDAVFDAPLYRPSHVKDLTVVAREQFDGRQAYRVKVTYVSGNEQFEFFDVESGLLIGSEARRETLMGVMPTTMVAREYRTFGGLRLPTVLVQKALGFEQQVTLTSYEFNTVAPETFALPARIKALIKTPASVVPAAR